MSKFFTKEVQIALVAIIGLVLLFYGMKFLKGKQLFSNENYYHVILDDVTGLSASSPVYMNGVKVGVIEEILFDFTRQDKVVATATVDNRLRLAQGTKAEIVSDMLGNVKLQLISPKDKHEYIHPGDTIEGEVAGGLMSKASDIFPQIEKILPKIDSILTSINILLADPAIKNTLHHVDNMTDQLVYTSAELRQLSVRLNEEVPTLLGKANSVMSHTDTLTKNLSEVDVAQTMKKVNMTLDNVQQMTAKLNSDEGTLGLLMRDPSLYRNLNATAMHADSLVIDLKQHPKRYVHFSIFGKKDK